MGRHMRTWLTVEAAAMPPSSSSPPPRITLEMTFSCHRGDIGEIQGRCRGDTGEMRGRYSADMAQR